MGRVKSWPNFGKGAELSKTFSKNFKKIGNFN